MTLPCAANRRRSATKSAPFYIIERSIPTRTARILAIRDIYQLHALKRGGTSVLQCSLPWIAEEFVDRSFKIFDPKWLCQAAVRSRRETAFAVTGTDQAREADHRRLCDLC